MAGTTQAMIAARKRIKALGGTQAEAKKAGHDVLKAKKRGATNKEAIAAATIQGGGSVTARQGDSVFSIAQREFGDQRFAEQILAANQRLLGNNRVVRAGDQIFIPRLRTDASPTVSFGGQAELLQLSERSGFDTGDDFQKLGKQITDAGYGIDPETGRIVRSGTGITSGGDVIAPTSPGSPPAGQRRSPGSIRGQVNTPAQSSPLRTPIQDLPPGLQNQTVFSPPLAGQSPIGPQSAGGQFGGVAGLPGANDPRTLFSGRGTGANFGGTISPVQQAWNELTAPGPRLVNPATLAGNRGLVDLLGGFSPPSLDLTSPRGEPVDASVNFSGFNFQEVAAALSPSGTNTTAEKPPSSLFNKDTLPSNISPQGRQPFDLTEKDKEKMLLAEGVNIQRMLTDDTSSVFMSDDTWRKTGNSFDWMEERFWQRTSAGWVRQPGQGESAFTLPEVPGALTEQEVNNVVSDIQSGNFSLLNPWASGVSPQIRFTGTRVRPIANNQAHQAHNVRNQNYTPALRGLTNWRQPFG